jgi:hypothetical protein
MRECSLGPAVIAGTDALSTSEPAALERYLGTTAGIVL